MSTPSSRPPLLSRRRLLSNGALTAATAFGAAAMENSRAASPVGTGAATVHCRTITADGIEVFYREAGATNAPVMLLLHGFPNSSHYFRGLMPLLADRFRLIAPDFPSFGFTVIPDERRYSYSFASITQTLSAFVDALALKRYALYVFDYGAPIGLRHALVHPERITALVTQNGNAYDEGLGADFWRPVRAYWRSRGPEQREALRARLTLDGVREAYLHGAPTPLAVTPEAYWLDYALMARPGNADIQLDLKFDYKTNIDLYPQFQAFLRQRRPPTLVIWGAHDPAFIPPGATAFRRDVPNATVQLLDAGHFALETEVTTIAAAIRTFSGTIPSRAI